VILVLLLILFIIFNIVQWYGSLLASEGVPAEVDIVVAGPDEGLQSFPVRLRDEPAGPARQVV